MYINRILLLTLLLCLASSIFAQQHIVDHIEDLHFRSIGPAGMSGRVTTIDVDPHYENRIAVGTASGGIWISDDGGIQWTPVFDSMPTQSIGAIKFDPRRSGIIWAGTGEGNPRNSHNSGKGIFKSLDGGNTWKYMGLENTKLIHRIIIHPWDPDIVYVAALGSAWGANPERGVYKTTDGGKTFKKVLYVNDNTGCADLIIDPSNPDKLIAAMWDFERKPYTFRSGGPGSGLYISRDGGGNWEKVKADQGIPKGTLGRIGLAISDSNPNIIYALIEAKKNGLYKSSDGGQNWKVINRKDIGNRPFYYADIFVNPKNPNELFNLYSYLSKSEDGGKSFNIIGPYSVIHPDHHAFWIDTENPNYIIEGNDGGLNISYDGGKNWRFVRNLPVGQFYHVQVDDQFPYRIYGGMQDNGSWVGPSNVFHRGGIRSSDWQEILFGDGFDVLPQPGHPEYAYAMYQGGNLSRVHIPTGQSYTIKPVSRDSIKLRFNWNAPIAKDPFNAEGLYFGSQFVHYSNDEGQSWKRISPDLTTNNPRKQKQAESGGLTIDATHAENYTCLTVIEASPFDSQTIWAASDDGLLHMTTNGGQYWTECSYRLPTLPDSAWFTQIRISPHDSQTVYVVANDYRHNNWAPYAYITENNGETWRRILREGDVDGHCWSIVQDPVEEKLLFLGTDLGLYYSLDKGVQWSKWESFPSTPVRDLQIQQEESDLILGTFGRSIYILDDLTPIRKICKNATPPDSVFHILHATDGYLMNYRSFEGERFPGNAIFSGQTSTTRPLFTVWVSDRVKKNKTLNRTEEVGEDTLVADSLELKRPDKDIIKMIIMDSNLDTVRFEKKKISAGIQRFTWSMRRDGQHFPRRRTIRKDEPAPRGARVSPGDYKIYLHYGDHIDSTQVTIHPDPRIPEMVYNSAEKLNAIQSYEQNTIKAAFEMFEQLKDADQTLDLIKEVYNEHEEVKDSVMSLINPLRDSIQQLQDQIVGPEQKKGIHGVTEYLDDKLRKAYYLLQNTPDPDYGNSNAATQKAKIALQKMQEKVDLFFEQNWQDFRKAMQQYPVDLFHKFEEDN